MNNYPNLNLEGNSDIINSDHFEVNKFIEKFV